MEIAILWALQYHAPNIHPSVQRLANVAGLSKRSALRVLDDLERKGWIERTKRAGDGNGRETNSYVLGIWGDDGRSMVPDPLRHGQSASQSQGKVQERHSGAKCQSGTGQSARGSLGQSARVAPKEEQTKPLRFTSKAEVHKTKELIPPLTPQHAEPTKPPQAAAPTDTKPTRSKAFKPTQEDIPATLLPVAHEILDFWAEKKGSHSSRAWSGYLTELAKIQDDPRGGTEKLRQQLNDGIQRGWRGVTHSRWLEYGGAALPFGNGTRPRSRVQPKAEFMAEFLQVHAQNTLRTI